MTARPFLARVAAGAGRTDGAEALRTALGGEGVAADSAPGLEVAWRAKGDGGPPGSHRVLCLIDGAIDGVDALRAELNVDGGEAAVLAAGYERLGDEVLGRLRGPFAVLLWDREARFGIVARDQLGGRPVHHRDRADGVVIGSEARDLLALDGGSPDRVALAHWLARRPPPGDRTLIGGISRLGAGRLIRLGDGRGGVERWWEPRYREPPAIGRDEAVAALREAMADAVGRALAGAADPAIMLSGGLDSACVAGLARELGSDATAYSQVFPAHPDLDESQEIGAIADELGIPVRRLTFAGGSALAAADRYARTWALPPSSPNWFVWDPLYDAVRADGAGVLLDGEGGDELFGCSPPLLADLLVRGRVGELIAQARRIPGMGADPPARRVRRAIAEYGVRAALPPAVHGGLRRLRRGQPGTPWLSPEAEGMLEPQADEWKSRSGPRWWASLAHSLVDGPDRMAAADEAGRAGGLGGFEVAHPWRDLALVELVLSLPPQLSFDPEHDRPLAREAARGLIPERVRVSDRKPVFNELLDDAFAKPDAPGLAEALRDPGDAVGWALRPEGLAKVAGPARSLVEWRVATAVLWARRLAG